MLKITGKKLGLFHTVHGREVVCVCVCVCILINQSIVLLMKNLPQGDVSDQDGERDKNFKSLS